MLHTENQKSIGYSASTVFFFFFFFFFFFEKRFLIGQLIRIHILFHIQMVPSVDITPHGDPRRGGGGGPL